MSRLGDSGIFEILKEAYGCSMLQCARRLESTTVKLSRLIQRTIFNQRCRRNKIVPTYLKYVWTNCPLRSKAARDEVLRHSMRLLSLQIGSDWKYRQQLTTYEKQLREELSLNLREEHWLPLFEYCKHREQKERVQSRDKLKEKFDKLYRLKPRVGNSEDKTVTLKVDTDKWVLNLSGEDLTNAQQSVLTKGMNFVPRNGRDITKHVIMSVEGSVLRMPAEEADEVRTVIMRSLQEDCRMVRHNLHREERQALKELRNNKKLTILKADKGNCTVMMRRQDYEEKIMTLLGDTSTYKKIHKDPVKKLQKEMNKRLLDLKKQDRLPENIYRILHCKNGLTPRFYGLPKIHKQGTPLRPIAAFYTSPTYQLSKHLP